MDGLDADLPVGDAVKNLVIHFDFHGLYYCGSCCHVKTTSAIQQLYEDTEYRASYFLLKKKDVVLLV